jgi:hypothetical protein
MVDWTFVQVFSRREARLTATVRERLLNGEIAQAE